MKFCPLKFNRPNPDDWGCEGCGCSWWNEYLGRCSIVVEAELKGLEVERQELKDSVELYKGER